MSIFSVPVEIADCNGGDFEWFDAIVDTGAAYTMLPSSTLAGMGVVPEQTRTFALADGGRRRFDIAEARLRYDDLTVTTIVAFNEEGTEPLLGAYTLEGLGLAVDPLGEELVELPPRA